MEKLYRKAIKKSNLTPAEKDVYMNFVHQTYKDDYIPEGAKVKINYDAIKKRTNDEMGFEFMRWMDAHKDETFTVEYEERYNEKKLLCTLVEDTSYPKWLFWKGDLTVIEESE